MLFHIKESFSLIYSNKTKNLCEKWMMASERAYSIGIGITSTQLFRKLFDDNKKVAKYGDNRLIRKECDSVQE